jgi:hypothetical protein
MSLTRTNWPFLPPHLAFSPSWLRYTLTFSCLFWLPQAGMRLFHQKRRNSGSECSTTVQAGQVEKGSETIICDVREGIISYTCQLSAPCMRSVSDKPRIYSICLSSRTHACVILVCSFVQLGLVDDLERSRCSGSLRDSVVQYAE